MATKHTMPAPRIERHFTIVFFTREGGLHPAWRDEQGTCYRSTEQQLARELAQHVANQETMRGAYAIGAYAGYHPGYENAELLAANQKPAFYIHEGGRIEKVA